MSIRAGILTVLGETEAYGLQIHGELEERTDRVGRINVGQIYSTLDRLSTAGLVRASGATDDGLPLYALTDEGRAARADWLTSTSLAAVDAWSEMTFKVLLATSLERSGAAELVQRYRAAWLEESALAGGAAPIPDPTARPGLLARRHLAAAALAWLDDLEAVPGGLDALAHPLRNERPRRGRRPATPEQ